MKLLHVVKLKFDTGSPDLAKFVQAQQKTKYGFFTKTRFLEKTSFFDWVILGLQLFLVFEALGVYIYIHRKIQLYTIRYNPK